MNPLEKLWNEVENNLWMLCDIGPAARELGYAPSESDKHLESHINFESAFKNPENTYWLRNGTFALLILAAEGEI